MFTVKQLRHEAHRLAKEMIKQAIRAQGLKLSDIPNDELDQAATALLREEYAMFHRQAIKSLHPH